MSIFVLSQGKFVFAIFTLIKNCTRDFSHYTYVALTNNMADTCVRLRQTRVQARPVSGLGKMIAQCTRIAYVVGRGLRLLTKWRELASAMRQLTARVSMSKICNRYLAKIDIWYNI